MMRTAKR